MRVTAVSFRRFLSEAIGLVVLLKIYQIFDLKQCYTDAMHTSDEDTINDLKQFIGGLFSQQNAQLEKRFEAIDQRFEAMNQRFGAIDQRFEAFEQKFDGLSDFVKEAIDVSNEASGEQLADLEQRVTELEQAAA